MTAITDRIAAEHGVMSSGAGGPYCRSCGAIIPAPDGNYTIGHARHIAEVTEAAVREQVARDIEAVRGEHLRWYGNQTLSLAARIARGAS